MSASTPLDIADTDAITGLRAHALAGGRGHETLFRNLSFRVLPGELLWLRGHNGSGKTTLLRTVAGLSTPFAGSVRWNGQSLRGDLLAQKSLVYLGHHNGLKEDLSAVQALRFLSQLHGRDASANGLHAALRSLGVYHRRNLLVRMLSQGQRRRVALARLALETQPGLWVLDEPLEALDDGGQAIVRSLLQAHVQRAGSVLMTSHIALQLDGVPVRELHLSTTGVS